MGKKIAIVTLQSTLPNYGNKLQNYAVQKIYQDLGYEVETLKWDDNLDASAFRKALKKIKSIHARTDDKNKKNIGRIQSFKQFNEEYICYNTITNTKRLNQRYDFFSVGSDQVWNPFWYNNIRKNIYLLTFAISKQKICISPSFGIEELPQEWKPWFSKYLQTFRKLSVREEAGADIIKRLIGRDAEVLVDPTMMLSDTDWRSISKKPKGFDSSKEYILTYFLSPKSNEAKIMLEEIKDNKNVYELLNDEDSIAYSAGPLEFLYLFSHASIVLTDSFHACVFSFLFDKPFVIFDRNCDGESMNSRIETFLSKFFLERKYYSSGLENDIWEHDYTEGYKQLEIERKKAFEFLRESLEV